MARTKTFTLAQLGLPAAALVESVMMPHGGDSITVQYRLDYMHYDYLPETPEGDGQLALFNAHIATL